MAVCIVYEALMNCLHEVLLLQSTFLDNSVPVEGARDYGHTHLLEVSLQALLLETIMLHALIGLCLV